MCIRDSCWTIRPSRRGWATRRAPARWSITALHGTWTTTSSCTNTSRGRAYMPESENRLRANDAECAAKVLDGEAVIINLLNGTYYSLDKAGAVVWELAADGGTIAEIVGGLTARYEVD